MPKLGCKHSIEAKEKIRKGCVKAFSTQKHREKMRRAKTGTPLAINSLSGASETNKFAKDWWFIKDGKHYRFRNLNKFVRDNKHLFTDDELTEYKTENRLAPVYRATTMLRNLLLVKKDGSPIIPSYNWNGWTIGEKWENGHYNTEVIIKN